ncbi:MAG TPA: hypothetical protein VFB95_11640 [Candidatus Cryosericum sp.]|nr:hypothetical protein [Candidatus Cryosericum sp.]
MKHILAKLSLWLTITLLPVSAWSQAVPPQLKMPSGQAISAAHKMAEQLFANLKAGESEKIAQWIVNELGFTWDATTKVQNMNDYKAKMDIIKISPPQGSFGALAGYDLIEESYLPGSDRYFRTTYISYQEGAPLIWEFRFYVKPDGRVSLSFIGWNPQNPFEYLAKPDMQLERWYKR